MRYEDQFPRAESQEDKIREFYNEARDQGLLFENAHHDEPSFQFDLNSGTLYAKKDAESISKLVELAKKYSDKNGFGICAAMLESRANFSDLEGSKKEVVWSYAKHEDESATLREWLKNNGYNVK